MHTVIQVIFGTMELQLQILLSGSSLHLHISLTRISNHYAYSVHLFKAVQQVTYSNY